MASTPILPFATWASGTNQNSIPANDNAMRAEILQRNVNNATTAQPGSPADGDCCIIQSTHTGAQWSTFTPKDIAIYKGGTWYAFAPVEGVRVSVSGASYIYTSGAWTAAGGGGTVAGSNKQIQYNASGSFGAEAGFEYDATTNVLTARHGNFGSATTFNANSLTGDDQHFVNITNDPSVDAGVGSSGKQLLRINSYGTGYQGNIHFCRYRGTEAAPTAVQSGDTFMSFGMRGWDSSAALSQSAASWAAVATENWTGSAHGIKYVWQVTANGSTTRANGMELASTGLSVTGTVSATVAVSSPASTTSSAGLKVPHGSAPTSPVDGDVWTTSAGGMYVRVNGVTVGPLAASSGGAAWGTITGTLSSQTDLQTALDAKAAAGIPQNSQSTAYTLVIGDANKHILHPSADTTARVFTIPANGSVAFPIGTAVTFVNQNAAGVVTISITTDTMRLAGAGTTGSRTLAANGMATALKITSTEWIISGTGLT